MKKALSLILVVAFCLGLCACGNNKTDTPAITAPATPIATQATDLSHLKAAAGTYHASLWFLDHTITLDENLTYHYGDDETGTFTVSDKYITMTAGNEEGSKYFIAENDRLYSMASWYFDADEEAGITLSPNNRGFSDQSFVGRTPEGNIPGCDYNWIYLDLDAKGAFTLKLGNSDGNTVEEKEVYEGTYVYKKSVLYLTYNGVEYPLIMSNANYIFFMIYDKA